MAKYRDVEDYMGQLPDDKRAVMERLRSTIRAAAADASEVISYNMPAFRLGGRFLVSYEAYKRHYSLFPWSDAMLDELGDALRPYAVRQGHHPVPRSRADPARAGHRHCSDQVSRGRRRSRLTADANARRA